jgi:hypothetical protein
LTETANQAREKKETLRLFHLAFLRAVRYSDSEIDGLGDLGKMSGERLQELLHKKTEDVHAIAIGKNPEWKFGLLSPDKKDDKKNGAR